MRTIIIFVILVICSPLLAQKSNVLLLDKPIGIDVTNKTISETLTLIGQQTGIKFSYSPAIIGSDRKVTLQFKNKPLRVVLEKLLGDGVQFKARNNFVIITPKTVVQRRAANEITITGYVYTPDGEGLAYASLYSKSYSVSAVTNSLGYFKITVPYTKGVSALSVRKISYKDTVVLVSASKNKIEISLQPNIEIIPKNTAQKVLQVQDTMNRLLKLQTNLEVKPQSTDTKSPQLIKIKEWFLSKETQANIKNISDTLFTKVQLSFLPQLSTNKLLVGNMVNDVSVSALVGYNKGVNYASVAGIMNVIDEQASFANVAGIANVIGDSMVGVQVAGLANLNNGVVLGTQVAGLVNFNKNTTQAVQISGGVNITPKQVTGIQVAGLANVAKRKIVGAQIAGVVNLLDGEMYGAQIAGTINIVRGNIYGSQVAGVCNLAKRDTITNQVAGTINIAQGDISGAQVAGTINIASGIVKGIQVSSLINIAKDVYGAQVGLINISKNIQGIPVGLISISKSGYHKLELFGDESMYTQLAYRTGVLKFHNIFTAGVDLTNRIDGLWSFGYGIGSFYKLPRNWNTGFEFLSQAYLTNSLTNNAVVLYGVNYLFEKQFSTKFSIGFGPTVKLMHNPNSSSTIAGVASPYKMASYALDNGGELLFWAGGKISLKIF